MLEAAPIEAIALDLVQGRACRPGTATDKVLVGGVIDGHNIWRGDLDAAFDKLEALRAVSPNVVGRDLDEPVPHARTTSTTSPS